MRKMLVIWLLIPFIGFSQQKNVINVTKVFAKPEKIAEFEKALTNHAQKYHTGDWKWRVWAIQSGPDAGGYMITEGPNTWDKLDGRADLGAEHTLDWSNSVSPLTEGQGSQAFFEFDVDLSTVELTDYADKILITHMITKPGKINSTVDMLKKMKNTWKAGNESVAVYRSVGSGDPSFIYVTRLKQGLKELAFDFRKPLKDRYDGANGQGSFDVFLKDYADAIDKRWAELVFYQPALSSK